MVEEKLEKNVNDIDVLDPVDIGGSVIIYEDTEETESTGDVNKSSSIPCDPLKTGNILKQIFNLVANFREKDYWELNDKEIKSLNNTCPKIIPELLSKHSGLISCILNLLGIIMKRLKLEKKDNKVINDEVIETVSELKENVNLTGGRTS